jgi:hypothetical protein
MRPAVSLLTLTQWVTGAGGEYQGAAEADRTIPLRSAREAKIMVFRKKKRLVEKSRLVERRQRG